MLRRAPNDETLWLPNDDDGCSIGTQPMFQSTTLCISFVTKDSNVKFNKMQNVCMLIIFNDNYLCFVYVFL